MTDAHLARLIAQLNVELDNRAHHAWEARDLPAVQQWTAVQNSYRTFRQSLGKAVKTPTPTEPTNP